MDTDVSLLIELREFHNKPSLRKVLDFVVVNSLKHSEFDEFKSRHTDRDYSILPINSLLDYWNYYERTQPLPTPGAEK